MGLRLLRGGGKAPKNMILAKPTAERLPLKKKEKKKTGGGREDIQACCRPTEKERILRGKKIMASEKKKQRWREP